jgi:hypothetical protein
VKSVTLLSYDTIVNLVSHSSQVTPRASTVADARKVLPHSHCALCRFLFRAGGGATAAPPKAPPVRATGVNAASKVAIVAAWPLATSSVIDVSDQPFRFCPIVNPNTCSAVFANRLL